MLLSLAAAQLPTGAEPALAPAGAGSAQTQPAGDEATNADPSTQAAPTADTDAPAKLVSPPEKPLPASIRPSSPTSEVIKLANSGLDESVMLSFVTNSSRTFNLGAEDIIYLKDIGVPGSVVTAMIQRDQEIKSALAVSINSPQPGATAPEMNSSPELPANGPGTEAPPPGPTAEAPLTPPDTGGDEMFYDSLAPYGNWVDVDGYGRCWQPTAVVVNTGWQPYFDCGHWVYSDCGWYWLSDYSWGWAPFHYGCWFRHGRLGWCWVPGHTWGPSWVSWRYNDHYCGWAPLPPGAHFAVGVGLTFRGHRVGERDDFGLRPGHYHFVGWDHFRDRQLRPGSVPSRDIARIYTNSTATTRISGDGQTVINNGLPPSRVAAATHRPVQMVSLRDTSEPGVFSGRVEHFETGGESLAVYRPRPEQLSQAPHPARPIVPGTRPAFQPVRQQSGSIGGTSSLILRGDQTSAWNEKAPPNSLVVVGRGRNAAGSAPLSTSALSSPSAPSAQPAQSAPSASAAWERPHPAELRVPEQRPAPGVNRQGDWMGTVSRSPEPSWFGSRDRPEVPPATANNWPRPEIRTYQPSQRAPAAEVPRYTPPPAYVPQRSYSAPAYSAPAWSAPSRPQTYSQPSMSPRPAPSAPSAPPSAPAQSSGHSSSSNSRNGR